MLYEWYHEPKITDLPLRSYSAAEVSVRVVND